MMRVQTFRLTAFLRPLLVLFLTLPCTATAAAEEKATTLLLGDVSLNKLPFILAYDAGIYEKNGLSIKPLFSRGSVEIIRASGVDIDESLIISKDAKPPIKIGGASPTIVRLTTSAGQWDPVILGSTHTTSRWRMLARPGINSLEDLKGKRVGFSGVGAVTHFLLVSIAEKLGWDPAFDWSMMSDALGVDALEKGYVDAIVGPELHATMAVDAGYRVIADLADLKLPVAGSSFLFDREWLAAHPDQAEAFMKSSVEAIALLKTDKEAAFTTIRKWFGITDPELLEFFYAEAEKLPSKPYPPYEGLARMMEIYDSHEMRKYDIKHFYDDTIIRKLDETGYIDSLYE